MFVSPAFEIRSDEDAVANTASFSVELEVPAPVTNHFAELHGLARARSRALRRPR